MKDIDKRVTESEIATSYIGDKFEENNNKALIEAKKQIKTLKQSCSSFEEKL